MDKIQLDENAVPINRLFVLLRLDDSYPRCEFHSKTVRGAALKAASKGISIIPLVDVSQQKIHVFHGEKCDIDKKTAHTEKYNITKKSKVVKMAYGTLNKRVNLENPEDYAYVKQKYDEITL